LGRTTKNKFSTYCVTSGYKPSIEHYIAHLFYVKNTEGHFANDKHYDVAFFDNYTQKFPDVLKVNDDLSKSYEAITKDFLGNQVRNIRIKEYSLGLFNCEINSNSPIILSGADRPIACTAITNSIEQNFSSDGYPQFLWDAPLSATDFLLEVKKVGDSWGAKGSTSQTISRNYEQYHARQLLKDTKTNYNLRSEYVTRVSYKCGISGEWVYSIPELRFIPNQSGSLLDGKNMELVADNRSLKTGGSVTVTLRFDPKYSKLIVPAKSTIDLSYQGPGAHLITGPLTVSVNGIQDQVSFVVKTKTSLDVNDIKKIKIVASFLDSKADLDMLVKSSRYDMDEVSYDAFTFPPKPEIVVRDGLVDFDSVKKIKAVSDQSLEGFFVKCTLGINFTQRGGIVKKYLSVKSVDNYSVSAKPMYFWIPLKKNNPLKFNAISQYRLGRNKILRYSESVQTAVEYEEFSGQTNSDQQSQGSNQESGTTEHNQNNSSTTNEKSRNESQGTSASTNFDLPWTGGGASVNYSQNTSQSISSIINSGKIYDYTVSRNEGSWKGSSFTKTANFSKLKRYKDDIKTVGTSMPYFEKVYAYIEPFIACSLDEDQLIDIENYIDYDYFASPTAVTPTTIEECIRIIMEPNQFKPENINTISQKRLDSYLRKFKQAQAADLINIYSTIKKYLDSNKLAVVSSIEIDGEYSKMPVSFEIPYHEIFVLKTYPTDCSNPVNNKPHHQFVVQENRVASRFSWGAPASATEFQLQIQKDDERWENGSTIYPIPRSYHPDHRQPIGEVSFEDARTPYDISSTYKARFRFKCGVTSEWSVYSDSVKFTYAREKYQVSIGSITATRVPGSVNNYIISWDKVDGASGYYIEYADESEGLVNARQRLSPGPGKTNPYDVLRAATNFVYPSTSGSFLFKVTPLCNGMRGMETFKAFNFNEDEQVSISCPPVNEDNDSIHYYFNDEERLTLEWDSDYQHDQYQLKIIEKGQPWSKLYYVKTLTRPKDGGVLSPQHVISDKKFYAGTTYVAHIFGKCVNISRSWGDAYLELEFEGLSPRPSSTRSSSISNRGTVNFSSDFSGVRSRIDISTSMTSSPTLLIHPNPILGDDIRFSIKNAPLAEVEIQLFNILSGKQEHVEKRAISSTDEVLTVQKNLRAGYYVLRVLLPNGDVLKQQFEKE